MDTQIVWEDVRSLVESRIDSNQLHRWPFKYDVPIDVRFIVLNRREDVRPHQPDHLEVFFMESGRVGYEVDGRAREIKKNDVVVVGEGIHHRVLPTHAANGGARIAVLSFLPQLLLSANPAGDDLHYLMPFSMFGSSAVDVSNVISDSPVLSREIFDWIQRVLKAMPGDCERSRLAARTYLRMILFALADYYWDLRAARGATRRIREEFKRLRPALQHVQENYARPIPATHAARLCAMSQTCFMEVFKQVTGQPFSVYLRRFRIGKAQELLVSTEKTLSEISYETGFCDQSHFGAVFRQVIGKTPLAYRLSAKSWDLST
jgi:AraC-like DNA-binding protein/mannose-6-phosphate isomerase-like protein (cupin superfamily)